MSNPAGMTIPPCDPSSAIKFDDIQVDFSKQKRCSDGRTETANWTDFALAAMSMKSMAKAEGMKDVEDMTEGELLKELGGLEPPVSEEVLAQRRERERQLHQKRIKTKRQLREKVLPQTAVEQRQQARTGWEVVLDPKRARAEFVENLARPTVLTFYHKVKCDCEECTGSGDKRWDIINGMKCLLSLNEEAPPKRALRRIKGKDANLTAVKHFSKVVSMELLKNVPIPAEPFDGKKKRQVIGSGDWSAEVVVITSSLQSSRRPFNDSLRIMHFLNCKGVEYFAIDVNDCGVEAPDRALIARWRHLHWIFRTPIATGSKSKRDVVVPQIFIDGVPIGGVSELLILDDDNDLDYLLSRDACPNCLRNRIHSCGKPPKLNSDGTRVNPPHEVDTLQPTCPKDYCFNCGAVFRELINDEILPRESLSTLIKRSFKNPDHLEVPTYEKMRRFVDARLPIQMVGEQIGLPSTLDDYKQHREQRLFEV